MAVSLLTALVSDLNLVLVVFDGLVDASDVEDPVHWSIVPNATPAVPVDVVESRYVDSYATSTAWIWIEPGMSPGRTYDIGAVEMRELGLSTFVTSATVAATAPLVDPDLSDEWQHGLIRTLTRAFAEELQHLGGTPTTILRQDYKPDDTSLFLESTLGFSSSGAVFIDRHKLTYTGKQDSGQVLTGVVQVYPDGMTIPARSVVSCDQESVPVG